MPEVGHVVHSFQSIKYHKISNRIYFFRSLNIFIDANSAPMMKNVSTFHNENIKAARYVSKY